jgi:exosortase family protein XrtF
MKHLVMVVVHNIRNALNNAWILLIGEKQNLFQTFLLRFGVMFLSWKVAFHLIWTNPVLLESYNQFSLEVIAVILKHVSTLLGWFSFDTIIVESERLVCIQGTIGVSVGEPCIGFGVHALYIALILSYGNEWRKKFWFILIGSVILYVLNISRITGLALLVQYSRDIWDLNHKLIFKGIIYSFVFVAWIKWVKVLKKR